MGEEEPRTKMEKEMELQFTKINLEEIKKSKQNLPLKPCIRCQNFVNYDTHTKDECALFHHEKFKSGRNHLMDISEEEDTNEPEWRDKKAWKYRGAYSFSTNNNRRKRQEDRKRTSPYFGFMKANLFSTQNNTFEWHNERKVEKSLEKKEEEANIDELLKFLNREKKRTISVEGNIGSGKSTLIKILSQMSNAKVCSLREPLEKWTDVKGTNLLANMYSNGEKWAPTFQLFAMLTMLENHKMDGVLKIMERNFFSTKYVFLDAKRDTKEIDEINYEVISNWFDFVKDNIRVNLDAIIYLRTTPKTAFERVTSRQRSEEHAMKKEYIELIHDKYEQWLIAGKKPWPCQIITLDANKPIKEVMKQLSEEVKYIR